MRSVKIVALLSKDYKEYREALEGFRKALSDSNIRYDITLINNMEDDVSIAKLVNDIRNNNPDLILAIGSRALYKINTYIKDIPIVFSMVLNPNTNNSKNTRLTNNGNITGVTLSIPVRKQFAIFKEILPNLITIGVIYSPEENGKLVEEAKSALKQLNIDLIAADVKGEREVPKTLNYLINVVDAIWIIVDNAVNSVESMRNIILESVRNDIPVMGPSEKYVKAGATFAVSADYESIGMQSGEMAIKILNGKQPSSLPIEYPQDFVIYINEKITNWIGLKIPDKILNNSIKISK
ncbi:MAG: ABC transporter substrate-binding protein [Candidatus Helarchaeota archaeon]|nr:ABC transporter substrate-binding protein [Candidatus Helarchaeota archaeon]